MATAVFRTVGDCKSCLKNRGTVRGHQTYLKLFPEASPMDFLAMDLLDSLHRTENVNRHVLVITDRFANVCRSLQLKDTKATTVAQAFLTHWVYP